MRAQLAVSSLIVFGILLIGLGFIQLPYIAITSGTVIVQTFSEKTIHSEEVITATFTDKHTTTYEALTKITTVTTETFQTLIAFTETLAQIDNETLNLEKPFFIGPFQLNSSTILEVLWTSDKYVELYTSSIENIESPNNWQFLGKGVSGAANLQVSDKASIYIVLNKSSSIVTLKQLKVLAYRQETTIEARQRTMVVETRTLLTTLAQLMKTSTYTTFSTATKTDHYTVAVQTVLTETRYADLWFMTAMGSFLVFTGLLLMVLLLRTLAKPFEKTME